MGNPKECRDHAMSCLKQAENETPSGRITLLAVAQQWLKLATEMENSETFLEVMNHLDSSWNQDPDEVTGTPAPTNGNARP
jgi:hypothetical protein